MVNMFCTKTEHFPRTRLTRMCWAALYNLTTHLNNLTNIKQQHTCKHIVTNVQILFLVPPHLSNQPQNQEVGKI